ncbi:MAG: hypothetical protein O3B09_02960 [Proteobacteria bacterium]|nr:hypothetical protein [Pseudomonadota bacterium]
MTTEKWISISTIVTKEQQEQLDREAGECGMTRSEYIKARLFIDKDNIEELRTKNLSKFQKDLISVTAKGYCLLQEIAKGTISKENIDRAFDDSDKILEMKGYKSKEQ